MSDTPHSADAVRAKVEIGGRTAQGFTGNFIFAMAFTWSAFQLYVASSIPFFLSEHLSLNVVFNNQEVRQIHLAFALALAMLAYPIFKSSPADRVPASDWLLAAVAALSCLYLFFNKNAISDRAGLPTTTDMVMSALGIGCLAIAVFRALGLPLVIVSSVFLFYVFFGHMSFMPDVVQWKGASFGKASWHFWMQTEGVFGVALGVAASMIFLFVLFGALLEKAGAGNYFIKLAFASLGHLRGGPAKAAVVASAASGMYSGSSIANVVTTGTFTIPLMKRTGFTAERAGAVEVAASTNGQLTPPVMGAAAFLISEFTGVSYPELIKHAFLPAIISYIALVYIVHLEALKLDLKGLPRTPIAGTVLKKLTSFLTGFLAMAGFALGVYYGLGWINDLFPSLTRLVKILLIAVLYIALLALAAKHPDLEIDNPEAEILILPRPRDVAVTGLYFLLPILVLVWNILVDRLSPSFSAYWATLAMIVIVFTQHPLKSFFRGETPIQVGLAQGLGRGLKDFKDGMTAGARNMIGIGVATGAAGVIIGTVSLTGAHQVIGELVEYLSGGSLMVMLLLVAVMSLILGMGLPTTANYIVVSSLMAPVMISVGAQSGLIVPLIAVHLFVFYFGILADDTPPVGLAALAAAAISGGDPIKTGIQGFTYDIRTALLPFLFIFNTELLLIDVSAAKAVLIFIVATVAMMLFAAATQGYFLARSRRWESLALILIALTLLRPGYWLDRVQPPYDSFAGSEIVRIAESLPEGSKLRLVISGPDFDNPDDVYERTVLILTHGNGNGLARLEAAGLSFVNPALGELDSPFPGSALFEAFEKFDFYGDIPVMVTHVQTDATRLPKELFYIPAFLLLGVIITLQRRRQTVPAF